MLVRLNTPAALLLSAAFVFSVSVNTSAQAPIVDASVGSNTPAGSADYSLSPSQPQSSAPQPQSAGVDQGELFYQLQLLQQEVMQLRGQVEEQSYQLQQLKEQNMERYIDLDRRLGSLAAGTSTGTGSAPTALPVSSKAQPGEKKAYDNAYGLVLSKRFDDALDAFRQFLVDYPAGRYAPNSYYWMGELYQVVTPANLDAAREAFSQLLGQYPDHAKAPDAMYKLGKVYFLKGNKAASKEWLEKVIAEHSTGAHSSAADKARQFLNANF